MLVQDRPVLFSGLGNEFKLYLVNFLLLRKIYIAAKQYQIITAQLYIIRLDCKEFIRTWQELYYRGEPLRLYIYKINVYTLLYLGIPNSTS